MIKLEYFTKADFPQLLQWIDDEYIMTNWAGSLFRFPLSEASLDWYLEGANQLETADVLIYKAVETVTGEVVGHISLGSINRSEGSARISRVLVGNTTLRGKGICQGMMKGILRIGFDELNLHRIGLGVYDFNVAAIGCYKKAGFSTDGLLRDVKKFGDAYWSLVEMSILQDEWKSIQEQKQALLQPVGESKAL
jgi:RimJ/RimL family protein N-acetyltransferase